MMDFRTPRGIVAILAASGLGGLFLALALTEPPEPKSGELQSATEWRLPELRETGSGMDLMQSLIARAPWGGRLAEAGNRANPQPNAVGSAGPAERQVANWRYLGSVRRGGVTKAVFLDENGETVHLAAGALLREKLRLAELQDDYVVFESVENSGLLRLQLFGETALELESPPKEPDGMRSAGEIDDE